MNTSNNRRSGRLRPTGSFRPSDWFDTPWRWRLLLGAAGLPAGIVFGFCAAVEVFRTETDTGGLLAGIYFGVPIGALVGIIGGVLLGIWIDHRSTSRRLRFTVKESLAMLFIVVTLAALFARFVYPTLLRM